MQLGMIGLGRMGANMTRRLLRGGHTCSVYDVDAEAAARLAREGAKTAASPRELVEQLSPPRVLWLMVPATTTTCAARARSAIAACTSSTWARAGACSDSSAATA